MRTRPHATPGGPRTCSRSGCCRGSTAGPTDVTERWIEQKFARKPAVAKANLAAFNAGWSFGETTELLDVQYRVKPATDVSRRVRTATSTERPRWRSG
jgi:hypothetical protein